MFLGRWRLVSFLCLLLYCGLQEHVLICPLAIPGWGEGDEVPARCLLLPPTGQAWCQPREHKVLPPSQPGRRYFPLSLYSPQRTEALSSGPQHLGLVFCWLVLPAREGWAWLSVRGGNNLNGGGWGEGGRQASYNCQFNSELAGVFYRNLMLLEEEGGWRPELPDSGIPSALVSLLNQTPGEKRRMSTPMAALR